MPTPAETAFAAFWAGLRPDPLPPMPATLPRDPADAWWLGATAGIRQGRRLAVADHEAGRPLLAPEPDPIEPAPEGQADG